MFMPTTMKQKSKGRSSREADIISALENMDVMLGNSHSRTNLEEVDSLNSDSNELNSESMQ